MRIRDNVKLHNINCTLKGLNSSGQNCKKEQTFYAKKQCKMLSSVLDICTEQLNYHLKPYSIYN